MRLRAGFAILVASIALSLSAVAQHVPLPLHDARTTPPGVRAPMSTSPEALPDFALFRECEGCPEMVILPAGTFLMGSPPDESGRAENEDTQADEGGAQASVHVGRFAIARFETTWAEWEACMAAGLCRQRNDSGFGRGDRPVINVDWLTDTRAFVQFVAARSGSDAYRLPSEAEWEYAARGGATTAFPWGESADHDFANFGSDKCCLGWASGRDQWVNTAPVGQFPANGFGLFDMIGNVREWLEDCYQDNLAGRTAAAYTGGRCTTRVARGGDIYAYPSILRVAYRSARYPDEANPTVGFRLARTL
jgi:formylglycine-generating enzyme required for sulfatase activity